MDREYRWTSVSELADQWFKTQQGGVEGAGDKGDASLAPVVPPAKKLGWKMGVLVPCLLNIWGGAPILPAPQTN